MPKARSVAIPLRDLTPIVARQELLVPRRRLTTLGDLISAACQVTGSTQGAARLLGESSPLGHLLDRRIVIG